MITEKYTDPNWDEILNNVNWIEFEHENNKFRTGRYDLDGAEIIGIHVFLGEKSPDPSGWAGMPWCNKNEISIVWPSKEKINYILNKKQDFQEPQKEKQIQQLPKNIPISPPTAKRY